MSESKDYPPLPAIEDFLNLKDWSFKAVFLEGQVGNYFWFDPGYWIAFEDYIAMPERPYCIVMTAFDGYGGAGPSYGRDPGWREVGVCAVSEMMTGRPQVNYGADIELMLVDRPIEDDELLHWFSEDSDYLEARPENAYLWAMIEEIQPYCYAAYNQEILFAARNKELVDALHSPEAIEDVERKAKERCREGRAKAWADLGPERGPEQCVEPGCERLRIPLAIRCFFHQGRCRPSEAL